MRVYLHIVLERREIISSHRIGSLKVSYGIAVEELHLLWIPVSIIAALVLEVEFYAILNAFNILFDNLSNTNVLFVNRKFSSIGSLLLVDVSFNL